MPNEFENGTDQIKNGRRLDISDFFMQARFTLGYVLQCSETWRPTSSKMTRVRFKMKI